MMKKPEIQQTEAQARGTRIPVASLYTDRLRSLHIQQMSVAYGSEEYQYLDRQISELERRARQRVAMDRAIGL